MLDNVKITGLRHKFCRARLYKESNKFASSGDLGVLAGSQFWILRMLELQPCGLVNNCELWKQRGTRDDNIWAHDDYPSEPVQVFRRALHSAIQASHARVWRRGVVLLDPLPAGLEQEGGVGPGGVHLMGGVGAPHCHLCGHVVMPGVSGVGVCTVKLGARRNRRGAHPTTVPEGRG